MLGTRVARIYARRVVASGNIRLTIMTVVSLQPRYHRVLGASLRQRRFVVPQGRQEASGGQPETSVRHGHPVPGVRRPIREWTESDYRAVEVARTRNYV